jgi:hypothetical protein
LSGVYALFEFELAAPGIVSRERPGQPPGISTKLNGALIPGADVLDFDVVR